MSPAKKISSLYDELINNIISAEVQTSAEEKRSEILSDLNFLMLGGSAGIQKKLNVDLEPRDVDFFCTDKSVFEKIDQTLDRIFGVCLQKFYREIDKGENPLYKKNPSRYSARIITKEFFSKKIPGLYRENKIHLNLVERILPFVEQVKLHIEKRPEHGPKIIATRFEGWQQVVYDLKFSQKLPKDILSLYILWLADQGKI